MPDSPSPVDQAGNETGAEPDQRNVWRRLLAFVGITALFVLVSLLTPLREHLNIDDIRVFAVGLGWWGPLIMLLLGILTPLCLLPRWPIAFGCGLLYGIGMGSLLANVASTLGAWLHFAFARSTLGPASSRLLNRYARDANRRSPRRVFLLLFFLRAFPLSNFVATNILAGSLRMRTGAYLAATFLGMIPSTLMYAAWGKLVRRPRGEFYLLIAVTLTFIILGTLAAQRYLRPWLRRSKTETAEADGPPDERTEP